MAFKLRPHHDLVSIQTKFATVAELEITRVATETARALGYGLQDVVDAVQALQTGDFIKSETAHSPPNSKVWHDTYHLPWDDRVLFLKFAGETLIDLTLTSFKKTGK